MRNSKLRPGTRTFIGLILVAGSGALLACGPSPEEQAATAAAQTAAAATNTPAPTLTSTPTPTNTSTHTPTPIPFDLSIQVRGEDDLPIAGVILTLLEAAEDSREQVADNEGRAAWNALPGEAISLSVKAQGYFPADFGETIERGPNELAVVLERDPHGLLPSEACAPGEELLYIEDFQDGEAQGWGEIEFRAQGFDLIPHPDSPGNMVVVKPGGSGARARLVEHSFENSVYRIRSMHHGRISLHFQWHLHEEPYFVDDQRVDFSLYEFGYSPSHVELGRNQAQLSNIGLYGSDFFSRSDVWHTTEISTFDGLLEIWLDGRRIVSYQDPKPMPGGGLGLDVRQTDDANAVAYFDDISVCGLTQPFVPLATEDPQS